MNKAPLDEPLHPATGRPLTDLERILWRFRMVAHEAKVMWRGFIRYPDAAAAINDDLMFGLTNQALIIVTKFLEVWKASSGLAKTDRRIVLARKAIQPVLDRILIWKGLETFRNSTLAHAYLTKEGKLLPPWQLFRTGLAPSYHAEIIVLLQLVVFGSLGVLLAFETEYGAIDPITRSPDQSSLDPAFGISLGTEIKPAVRAVCAEVDAGLMRELGIRAKGPLFDTFRNALAL